MSRSIVKRSLVLGAVFLAGGSLLAACGGGGDEQTIVRSFFQAARFDDRTSLGNMSLVSFTPQDDGIASGVGVDFVGTEDRRPLQMIELSQALTETRDGETNFRAEKKMYQDQNEEIITMVIETDREGEDPSNADIRRAVNAVAGRSGERAPGNNRLRLEMFNEVRGAWNTQVSEEREWARRVSEAQNALNNERRVVDVSLYDFIRDSAEPIETIEYGGELVTKQFTVTATVTMNEVAEEMTMCFTVEKADLHGVEMPGAEGEEGEEEEGAGIVEGRWIITGIDRNMVCEGHEAAE
jgi:hypothetical protein